MTKEQLNDLSTGAIVFIVEDTGTYIIDKYQYIGIVKNNFHDSNYHVFLSEYFDSIVSIVRGYEKRSRILKTIFILEADAKQRQKEMIEEDNRLINEG